MAEDGRSEATSLGAFAAPAGAVPVLVLEREGAEAVWDELLLDPSPPRPVRFVPLSGRDAPGSPLDAAPWAGGDLVVAAAGSAAGPALALAAADDRIVALLLVDPVAAPVDLRAGVEVLVVRSGGRADDGFTLPDGDGRASAVARIRAALAAPPFTPSSPR